MFSVQGSGLRAQGSGFRVQGSGFRVQCSGFRVQGLRFRVQELGFSRRVGGSAGLLGDLGPRAVRRHDLRDWEVLASANLFSGLV